MEDSEEDPAGFTEDDLYMGLIEALVGDAAPAGLAPIAASISVLERRIQVLAFERDRTRALMLTALSSRDTAHVERDAAFAARDAAVFDRDTHQAYANEVIGQARRVLDGQDRTVCMAMTLLERIDAAEHWFRSALQTSEVLGYLDFLARLTSDL